MPSELSEEMLAEIEGRPEWDNPVGRFVTMTAAERDLLVAAAREWLKFKAWPPRSELAALVRERDALRARVEELERGPTILVGDPFTVVPTPAWEDLQALRARHAKLVEAARALVEIGKRDLSNPKYASYWVALNDELLADEGTKG